MLCILFYTYHLTIAKMTHTFMYPEKKRKIVIAQNFSPGILSALDMNEADIECLFALTPPPPLMPLPMLPLTLPFPPLALLATLLTSALVLSTRRRWAGLERKKRRNIFSAFRKRKQYWKNWFFF